jgi:transcriptional regulator NrdR family protein
MANISVYERGLTNGNNDRCFFQIRRKMRSERVPIHDSFNNRRGRIDAMKIIKRNGSEADFDINKIVLAITKANEAVEKRDLTTEQINEMADYIKYKCARMNRSVSVEEVQDTPSIQLVAYGRLKTPASIPNQSIRIR